MPFLSHRSPVVLLSSVFLVSSLLASMISTPAPKKVEDTYKFGAVVSFNGDLKPWGDDCKRGIELAIEEFNADGGLDGKKIDLSMEDSNSKPEGAKEAAKKLIHQDKVMVVLGDIASGLTRQVETEAEESSVPVITPASTRPDLTKGHSNLFRVCYTDAFQGPAMAKFAYRDLGLRRLAIVTDAKQPFATGLTESFRKAFKGLGGRIVRESEYQSGDTNFQDQISKIKRAKPEGVFISGYFNEAGPFMRQAGEQGLKAKMLGSDGWDSSEILMSGGEAVLNSYFCNHYNNHDPRLKVLGFVTKWTEKFGSPPATTMAALGYDSARLACEALKRAKTKDAAGLRAAIEETVGFKGVTGDITLKGKQGNPPKRVVIVKLTREGQMYVKAIEPDPKTGQPK